MKRFVVVGGGLAAHQAARSIFEMSADAYVTIVGAEEQPAYDRPHLSKAFLAASDVEPSYLPVSWNESNTRVTTMFGSSVVEINRRDSHVLLISGRTIAYDKLIVATGSRVRKLGDDVVQAPVHYLRTLDDATAIRNRLVDGADVVVVGGGFIGLEVAAAARKRNCKVTVLEAQATLLARTGSPVLSQWMHGLHVSQGVTIHLNANVRHISHTSAGKIVLDTSAGLVVADVVVIGIGVLPNDELARDCGLRVDNGIVVDSRCATLDPNVFAAGEVTNYPITHLGTRVRSESWMAASDQGGVAGRAAAGDTAAEYGEMPWLWSDQFNSNIQCLGVPQLAAKHSTVGDCGADNWVLLGWDADDRLVNAIAVNRGKDVSAIRRAIKRGTPLPSQYTAPRAVA
ncbi:NAD(P)/FAD-dependent oxidoreductase [Caballeronia sp. 15715]|uniref:NAD(P)/FAD-dependent oxidoreductase n=1 Tax=Caballeronia sp. 15715 TaxID=3391030 RepID=UPI0039E6E8CD